ncbi:basic amino acid ABC transporter substrate-binding protein [Effusibacillus dendaii]|uniref:Basic amino acid ABC transporter substrate-binding protein n=1 Tax=Effusibacillus dendaii TaxID=2743772 RepID=A0A7I8DCR2_9BACL|nr:basic amino acid ABC transporter substrate-binding protein [Effusibacillus dendaii]BCJ87885.1 basic amino acid ABC transporter substrate-binding protein [Effusibacillus dendaii]
MQMKRGFALTVASLLLGTTLTACGGGNVGQAPAPNNGGGSAPQAKEYVVGTDAAYAPFESETEKKEIVGFDIDLLKAVADKAGFKVKFVNTPWEGIFTALQNGERDMLISAITITDDRKKDMDFSDPYFEAKQLIAVSKDSKIAKFDDLKGKKVGVQTGTTGDEVVTKLLGKDSPDIKRFESTPLALKELQNGGVEAVVADNGVVINYVKNNTAQGFKMVDDPAFEKEYYGIAVKKGNTDVLNKVNDGLKKIKSDGTYDKIYEQYFGKKQ